MKNLRKKIATVTKEEATKELTDFILEWFYEDVDKFANDYVEFGTTINEYLKMSENERKDDIEKCIFERTYFDNDELEKWTLSEIFKDKDISDEDKKTYKEALWRASRNAVTNEKLLSTLKEKIDKEINKRKENWNAKNTVNPDFNKGMNKINCIRVRLQKKLS